MPKIFLTFTLLVSALALFAGEPQLDFDKMFATGAEGKVPTALAWAPDGSRLGFFYDDGDGKALWVLDAASGETKMLGRADEGDMGSLDGFRWSPDGGGMLLLSDGDLLRFDFGADGITKLTETEDKETDPKFSPDGKQVAFVRDFDLHVIDLASDEERALTDDGEENVTLNGVTDWVYWEEIWNRSSTGFWWSPDGSKIAYYRFDETPVETYPLVDFTTVYPEVTPQKYPKAGQTNPVVKVGVLDLESGDTTWMRTHQGDFYLARVDWTPGGGLAIQRLNREQNQLDLLQCDVATGYCESLLTESWPTWVNLGDELTFLSDGRFVWSSERSGWKKLYLYEADGTEVRPLSPEGWAVTSLDAVDPAGAWLLFTGHATTGMSAIDRHVFRLDMATATPERLDKASGWNGVVAASKTSGLWVHSWTDADTPRRLTLRDARGGQRGELPQEAPTGFDPAMLPGWAFFEIDGPEGSRLPAALLKPTGFDPEKKYPVVMYHYGGPGSQVVRNAWASRGRGLWHKMMAERGYVVLMADNQGSTFFGKRGEDRLHRRFGEINLAAQLAAVEWLQSQPWVDGERIGLWGWSGGGSNTLYCLLNSPGTWRAGTSGAPVTDWRFYDTIWTERYLDHPDDNPDGYRDSSAVTHADKLADSLLIVHGTADDNVHPQNTIAFTHQLVEANKPFDEAIYPRQKHGVTGIASRHFYERMTRFFAGQLAPGED